MVKGVEVPKDDALLELTERLRERVDDEGSEVHSRDLCMPRSHIGSVQESLSRRWRIALSSWPLPCFATVKSADDLPLGELEGGGIVLMRWGKNRSVAEELDA